MFKTIFTVTKKTCDSTEYSAFFEDFDKAKEFAEKESKNLVKEDFCFYETTHFDGSYVCNWSDRYYDISLDDFAWVTDWRVNGIGFYHSGGILTEFENYEELQRFILKSQEIALS